MIELCNDLMDIFPVEASELKGDMVFVRLLLENTPMNYVAVCFIYYIYPHRKEILNADMNFFLSETKLFGDLPAETQQTKVPMFKDLIKQGHLDDEDIKMLITYFKAFFKKTDQYMLKEGFTYNDVQTKEFWKKFSHIQAPM